LWLSLEGGIQPHVLSHAVTFHIELDGSAIGACFDASDLDGPISWQEVWR